MKDLDQRIAAALATENERRPEPNIAEEVIGTFRGRRRWMAIYVFVASMTAFGVAIWAGLRFYHATDVQQQLLWAGLTALMVAMVCMMKIWFWLEMQTNRVLREVKRLELRLVAGQMDKH